MWTPRRLIMIVTSMVLFSGGFTAYSALFGWIDGLPQLPENFLREQVDGNEIPTLPGGLTPLQNRLRVAFGPNCIEQGYNLKFESREKGILFAAADTKILEDGRVLLHQVSVAVFGKDNKEEMTTIHCDRAFLTYDQPVRKIDDLGTSKVKAAELIADPEAPTSDPRKGKVHIINNRRTLAPDDDVILVTPGPLYYMEEPGPAKPNIWTEAAVELTDRQMRPLATQPEADWNLPTVTGDGMRAYLTPPPPKGQPKPANTSTTGVDRVELDRNVLMNLWTESKNMLGSTDTKPATPQQRERVLITIQTNGPFYYDMIRDFAHFEIPPPTNPNVQEYVKVVRHARGNMEDTLTSDFLDVQFTRKRDAVTGKAVASNTPVAAKPAGSTTGSSGAMEIETLHAWGKHIALSSDDESLFAYGHDLVHNAIRKETTLKGEPMHAVKNGSLIRAPELLLSNLDDKDKQNARARGPGVVGMGPFDPKTQEHSQQAHWTEYLVVTKVREQGKDLDLITLTGQAKFIDTVNVQRLDARQIKLWMIGKQETTPAKGPAKLEPPKKAVEVKQAGKKKDGSGQLPHRLEAVGDVMLASPDLMINRSEYLNTWFKDVPAPPPAVISGPPMDGAPPKVDPRPADPVVKQEPVRKDAEKKNPMIIRHARRIEAWVNRIEGKNDLDKVHHEGNVVIHQDPSPGNEKGVDIAGHTVDLQHFPEGDYLIVEGNENTLGEVHFDKISIVADDIKIDQRDNTANVRGPGSMRILSKSSLDGTELKKPSYIDIFWNLSMDLDGPLRSVRYEGTVQGKQDDKKVLCETMQVWLDRPLYLNQAAKPKTVKKQGEDDSPKVEKVLCDQLPSDGKKPARLQQVSADEVEKIDGRLVKQQNVLGTLIEMDNVRNTMTSVGPGTVRIFQAGAKDPNAAQPPADPKKPKARAEEEMKLTWVKFDNRMVAYSSMPKRAVFRNNCEMVHMASPKPDVEIDITRLVPGAMYLKCDQYLEVTTQSRKAVDRTGQVVEIKWQEMKAEGNVKVRSDDYDGMAGVVTFSEEKSLLVFIATRNPDGTLNPAVLSRAEIRGGERKTFRGEKITYNTKTKDFSIDGSVGGNSN